MDEPTNSSPSDAASVMQATISEFSSQGNDPAPAPTPAPAPDPVAPSPEPTNPAAIADPNVPDPNQPADPAENDWYAAMMADFEQQPDELAGLLNEETFNGLRENPQGLGEWAAKAFGHLQRFNAGAERERTLSAGADHIGGWDNASRAFDIYGDLFRGHMPLEEADAAFPNASNYAERALMRVMQDNKLTAYTLGAAVLNHMPDLLKHKPNADYVLRVLGYDPQYADDFKRVAENGGFHIQEDQAAINEWFKNNEIPLEQLATLRRLPLKVQRDILGGDAEASKFHLQEYHDKFVSKDREAKAESERVAAEKTRIEYQSAQTMASEKDSVFKEYVARGKRYGLNDLESAGLAAMAYSEIEEAFWDDKSEVRKTIDRWHEYVKGGNKLQSDSGRSAYRKAFEDSYRKVASRYQPRRLGVPPSPPKDRQPGAPNGNQPQFTPPQPPDPGRPLTASEQMEAIMRDYGVAG